ncbi:MAG: hypothetical protein KatS3mg076_2889 [Candidatus Binatia bacterium]|nr:MAG: hypothetical protein KatS3mg076_2889 [Candidatus Binatia bacterium]
MRSANGKTRAALALAALGISFCAWARAGERSEEVFFLLARGPAQPRAEIRLRQRRLLRRVGTRFGLVRLYRSVAALALRIPAEDVRRLAREATAFSPLIEGGGALAESGPLVGAPTAHALGLRGAGTLVAVLDTGVDSSHPDVEGRIVDEECFCTRSCCPDGGTRMSGGGSAASHAVHGPHVAGIVASAGRVSAPGIAPEARLLAVRVLDDTTRGNLADWIAALDWIATRRPDVDVVNMSLVSDALFQPPCDEANAFTMAFADLARTLRERGTVVVAATGNLGRDGVLPAPACVSGFAAVGATTKEDDIASFTNLAPGVALLAPGVGIVSDSPGGGTAVLSGTSMATPHVAGALALLAPLVPRLHLPALVDVLSASGHPLENRRLCRADCATFPRLDIAAALARLERFRTLTPGGAGRRRDCQVEWDIAGVELPPRSSRVRIPCEDGDPSCDADATPGQCTFLFSACLNVVDLRTPECDPTAPIDAYRLVRPSPFDSRDPTDLANVTGLLSRLPALPHGSAATCTSFVPFVVPRGTSIGSRSLLFAAETRLGRDADRLRFVCLPPGGLKGRAATGPGPRGVP